MAQPIHFKNKKTILVYGNLVGGKIDFNINLPFLDAKHMKIKQVTLNSTSEDPGVLGVIIDRPIIMTCSFHSDPLFIIQLNENPADTVDFNAFLKDAIFELSSTPNGTQTFWFKDFNTAGAVQSFGTGTATMTDLTRVCMILDFWN